MSTDIATLNIPKNPAERRVWIVFQLRLKGSSLRRLALNEGVTHQAMCNALSASSSHLEQVIATKLGLAPQQLFPERFGPDGNRLTWTRGHNRTTAGRRRNVKPGEAA